MYHKWTDVPDKMEMSSLSYAIYQSATANHIPLSFPTDSKKQPLRLNDKENFSAELFCWDY